MENHMEKSLDNEMDNRQIWAEDVCNHHII